METQPTPGQVMSLPLNLVVPDPNNPRKEFDEDALQDLADDIRLRGVEQPITVYALPAGFYRIKLGERRFRASQLAGMDTIPALIATDPDDAPELERLLDQVKENCLRKDLTPIEWGHFFRRLREDFHLQVKDIPEMLEQRGMKRISRSYVSNYMRLADLPEWASKLIASGEIPASYGKHLLVACESAIVGEAIREQLESPSTQWDKIDSERELEDAIFDAFHEAHPRLDRRATTWDSKQPLYKASELTDEDRAALGVRVIRGTEFVLNLEEHEKRQEAARAAGVKPASTAFASVDDDDEPGTVHGTPSQDRPVERKKPALPGDDRIAEYLTAWLRAHVIRVVFDEQRGGAAAAEDLARRLVSWAAFNRPTPTYHMGSAIADDSPGNLLLGTSQELGLHTLGNFLTDNVDPGHMHERVARALLMRMSTNNLMLVVAYLGIELQEVYRLDEAYLELHTKAGIEKLVKDCKLKASGWWAATAKLTEMRSACIARADEFGTPPQLAKEWNQRFRASWLAKFRASVAPAGEPAAPAEDSPTKPTRRRRADKAAPTEASSDVA